MKALCGGIFEQQESLNQSFPVGTRRFSSSNQLFQSARLTSQWMHVDLVESHETSCLASEALQRWHTSMVRLGNVVVSDRGAYDLFFPWAPSLPGSFPLLERLLPGSLPEP